MRILQQQWATSWALRVLACTVIGAGLPAPGLSDQGLFPVSRLVGIYEPSGIEHDGSMTLIIEDEKKQPLHVLTDLRPDGSAVTRRIDCGVPYNDTEGIASDGEFFYIAGSHYAKDDGTRRKKREFLARLDVSERTCSVAETSPSLYRAIQQVFHQAGLIGKPARINIEALAWQHNTSHLYVALREPLLDDAAILLTLTNPESIFTQNEVPRFSETIIPLQLSGGGIRAMNYIEGLDGYLIANESPSDKGKMRSRLWYWKGGRHLPEPVKLPGFKKLDNVEGLTGLMHESRPYVVFVSDDGTLKKNKGAHFALVPVSAITNAIKR